MKNIIYLLLITSMFIACKKDAIDVNESKSYSEVGYKGTDEVYDGGGMYVTLDPAGTAGFKLSGDAIYPATWKITGNTLRVYSNNETYKFKIVSDDELQYKDKVLKHYK